MLTNGRITNWGGRGRFCFVKPDADGPDIFVHSTLGVDASSHPVGTRVRVAFKVGDRGPRAVAVEVLP